MIIAATAHWAKFPKAILEAFGKNPKGMSLREMFAEIKKCAPKAKMHSELQKVLPPAMPAPAMIAEKHFGQC